ncbi:MAG TPA: ATP-binding protein [Longimicrobiaceae bacterium]|nr:ATP-binding protein [Longimicrobiaceae bacterium]
MSRMIPGGDTIHGRLRLVTGTVGALLVLSSGVGWWTTQRLTDNIRAALAAVEHETALSTRFAGSIALQVQAANRYLDTRDPAARAEFERLGATAHRIHRQLSREVGQTTEELALIARIDQQLSRAEALYARAHRLADLGRTASARAEQERAAPVVQATLADVERLGSLTARKVAGISARLQSDAVREGWQLVGLLLGAILIAVAVSRLVAGSISESLRLLVEHSERLSRGDLSARIPPARLPGEFRVLAASMNQAAAALEDLTAAESALHQAEKFAALGQLVSGVAHELNAPLAGALLETDKLLDAGPEPAERAALGEIRSRLLRSRRIIRDMLSFVKDRHAANEPVTPDALIDRALRAVEPQLREAGVKVRRTVPARLPLLMADRVGIEQALSNLLLNGAQAAGAGGTVHVAARTVDDWCEIMVEDNGPGIPPELLPRIFEPFFTTRAPGEGTGLGLSAALGVVEQHWGRLRAENRADHRGARFVMALPCTWDGSETPPAGSRAGS